MRVKIGPISMSAPFLSVVLPVYNEESNLAELHERLESSLAELESFELLYVNDASTDRSRQILEDLVATHPCIRVFVLSRNFGHQVALTVGLDHSYGQAVVTMDADLQDPPELIPELVRKWSEGYDVVYAERRRRPGESWFKRLTAYLFYRGLGVIASVRVPPDTGDFRLLSRKAVDGLKKMGERRRFLRGLTSWMGFRSVSVLYDRPARSRGESNYRLLDMLQLALTATFSFSKWPITLVGVGGTLICAGSLISLVAGFSGVVAGLFFLGGMQLVCLWIVGDYVSMIAGEVRARPLYILEDEIQSSPASKANGAQ